MNEEVYLMFISDCREKRNGKKENKLFFSKKHEGSTVILI